MQVILELRDKSSEEYDTGTGAFKGKGHVVGGPGRVCSDRSEVHDCIECNSMNCNI